MGGGASFSAGVAGSWWGASALFVSRVELILLESVFAWGYVWFGIRIYQHEFRSLHEGKR